MKFALTACALLLPSAFAAPAVVWKNGQSASTVHSSKEIPAGDLMKEVLPMDRDDSSLAAVVFLLARSEDGTEAFSSRALSGELPGVSAKYDNAHCIHHHVSDLRAPDNLARDAKRANVQHDVMDVSLNEFYSRLTSLDEVTVEEVEVSGSGILSKSARRAGKRSQDIAKANVLVVGVNSTTSSAEIDEAVVAAIDHASIDTVVVAGARSTEEVLRERDLLMRQRRSLMKDLTLSPSRRRLEDANNENEGDEGEGEGNQQDDVDYTGVYFVSMTPNIFSGVLFGFFFTVVTWIGISCMGMIAGQDVYVNKMPSIGREA